MSRAATLSRDEPFPGLRPFGPGDAEFFFGREDDVSALYRLLDRNRFIAVVGSSGSGKSSLVFAGLLPLLQQESDEPGGRSWRFVTMRPGDAPISALADALADLATEGGADASDRATRRERIEFELRRSRFGLARALDYVPNLQGETLVLVVDQFEELFRYVRSARVQGGVADSISRNEATNFVQLILEASRDRSRAVQVLITMRSDFIGDCSQFYDLPEAVSSAQFLVPSLTRDQREDVIRRPIDNAGGTIDSGLVQRLLNDASAETDQLPVLQHCLAQLWKRARERSTDGTVRVTEDDYKAVHTIAGALSQHADAVMSSKSLDGLEGVVEAVFRALSEVDNEGRPTRRALSFARLLAETGVSDEQLRRVLDRFRAEDCSFIVPSTRAVPELHSDTRIDVVHEALLRRWWRITPDRDESLDETPKGWLAIEAADGRFYRGLLALIERRPDGQATLPLDLVEEREKWWKGRTKAWAERYGGHFERVNRLFADSRAALDTANARNAELERLERQGEVDRRVARRMRIATVAIAIVALLAVAASVWALGLDRRVEAQSATLSKANSDLSRQAEQLKHSRAMADQQRAKAVAAAQNLAISEKQARDAEKLARVAEQKAIGLEGQARAAAGDARRSAQVALREASRARTAEQQLAKASAKQAAAAKVTMKALDAKRQLEAHVADLERRGREKAEQDATKARNLRAYNLAAQMFNAGVVSERDGLYSDAVKYFSQAIADYPDYPDAYTARGWNEHNLSPPKDADAIRDFDESLRRRPNDGRTFADLATVYYGQGNYGDAIKYYTLAIDKKFNVAANYAHRANAYTALGDYDLAIADATRAISGNPSSALTYEARAEAYLRKGDSAHAITDFQSAINVEPDYYYYYLELGIVRMMLGQYAQAKPLLVRSQILRPKYAYPALYSEVLRWKMGKPDTASFAADITYIDQASWPGAIIKFMLGQASADDVLAFAKKNDSPNHGRLCEADFYVGEYLLSKHNVAPARALLTDAAAVCPKSYIEYDSTLQEIARLNA